MFAKVILARQNKNLDKILDYEIPEGMKIELGDGVIVPFGAKNKPVQGYVVQVTSTSEYPKTKRILQKSEIGKCFDSLGLNLIRWIREKYLCTYEEAVSVMVPSGTVMKSKEWIVLEQFCDKHTDILETIEKNGGAVEYEKLKEFFEFDISHKISALIKMGAIRREFSSLQRVKPKTVRVVRLKAERPQAQELIEQFKKKNPVWAMIIEILLMNEFVSPADLKLFTNTKGSAVNTLAKKGIIEFCDVEVYRVFKNKYSREEQDVILTDEQKSVIFDLKESVDKGFYAPHLLFGVTGSGKTEVYMQIIEYVISKGRQAIVLVPEISLTPQTVNRFTSRFGERIAVLHSGLSQGQRFDQWRRIRSGDVDIVIGARSAVFAPLLNIGIIIIDEEHSDTYKSEMTPRYETKIVAEFRAKQYGALLLMASATPSVESFYRAVQGDLKLLKMKKRANNSLLPEINVVDMREELNKGNKSMISTKLYNEICVNIERKEQTILFLNRRGFSTFVSCRECGFVAQCPNCNISLTYHKFNNTLQCHYCGHTVNNYNLCPKCGSKYIRYFGGGTQKIEEEIIKLFPKASVIRMDIDTTGKQQSHEDILKKFENDKIDILIGTQMVTKGLDFENVTLVGVVSADTMLNIDDFRSGERTFGILEQVSGRAGRGLKAGRAIIQSYSPEHDVIRYVTEHNYERFYDEEIRMREILWYPPFCDMLCIGFSGISIENVSECAAEYFKKLKNSHIYQRMDILGPIPSSVSKIKNRYRWQILVKCENADSILGVFAEIKNTLIQNDNYKNTNIQIDKNPVHVY